MDNFFIIRNKEKNMYYWGDGSWTKIKDCARKHQHKDCAETLIYKDNLDRKNCEVVEIPSITDLEAKLAESERESNARYNAWQEEIGECNRLRVALAKSEKNGNILLEAFKKCHEIDRKFNNEQYQEGLKLIDDLEKAENDAYKLRYELAGADETISQLKQQLAKKEKEISQLYPFVKEHNNGNFIEYNVVYEKNGIVATTTFGRNKEMAHDYLKSLKKGN